MTTAIAPGIPSVRDLRSRLRQVRRTHSDRTLGELLTDVYLVAFLIVLYGGSSAVSLRRYLARPVAGPVGLATTRSWLAIAILVTVTALAWRALRSFGPLLATPAVQSWCLSTPIDRASWLRLPLVWLLALSGFVGAGVGVLVTWLGLPAPLVWALAAGAGVGVAMAAAAVVAEAKPSPPRRLNPSDLVLAVGVLLIAGAVITRATHITIGPPVIPAPVLTAVAVVAAVVGVRYAVRALGHIDRAALSAGAPLAGAAVSAAVMLDPSLLSGLVEQRRWRRFGKVHSRHWIPGGRLVVLLQADLRRQVRRRSALIAWAALVLVPYAVAVFSPAAVGAARIVAAYLAAERLAAGLRLVSRSAPLRRQLGGTDADLKLIHLTVPAIGLILWWYASLPAGRTPTHSIVETILLLGLIGAVYRTATRPPMSYDAGSSADTPVGPIPTTLIRRLLRGPDLVAVLVLVNFIF